MTIEVKQEEDLSSSDRSLDKVSHLAMSLYGTRDAAMNWQEEVAKEMAKWGFKRGRYNPCLYWHPVSGLMTLVHGDDFVSVGRREVTEKFKTQLEARFEIKTQVIGAPRVEGGACASSTPGGPKGQSVQEGRVLNRVVRWTAEGWEMEPDQRHVDIIIKELGLAEAKLVSTPGEVESREEEEENSKPLTDAEASRFRGLAARANCLAADRTDFMFSTKEICRHMATPV